MTRDHIYHPDADTHRGEIERDKTYVTFSVGSPSAVIRSASKCCGVNRDKEENHER